MTNQEIFDLVLSSLRKQGHASFDRRANVCMYRAEDGSKCAAGFLIDDADYRREFERRDVGTVYMSGGFGDKIDSEQAHMFVIDLQRAHDESLRYQGLQAWEEHMRDIALQYGLIYTQPAPPDNSMSE